MKPSALFATLFLILSVILCLPTAYAQSRTDDVYADPNTWLQRFLGANYVDESTFKNHRIYFKDPFTWAISKEFADEFGMPQEWVDPELKGALAVAWRTTEIGQTMCGHGGNPAACWPSFTCQMDIYIDNKVQLPWRFSDVTRDFLWEGLSSLDHVPRRAPDPRRARYNLEDARIGARGEPIYSNGWNFNDGTHYGGFQIIYFDRAYTPTVSVIGFKNACPPGVRSASLGFYSNEEHERTRGSPRQFSHTIQFSDQFMTRIYKEYKPEEEEHRRNNRAFQEITDRHFPSGSK